MQVLSKLVVVVLFGWIIWYFIGLEPSPQGYRTGSVQAMVIFFLVAFVTLVTQEVRARVRQNRSRKIQSRIAHHTYRREE